jgi:hypothetical protein
VISFFKNVGLYQFFFKKIRFLRAFSSFSTKNSSTFSNFSKNSKFGASFLNISIKNIENNRKLIKEHKKLLIMHGLDITTQRIRYYSNNRKKYLNQNMRLLQQRYKFWFLNPFLFHFERKKILLFFLLFLRQYSLVLWFYDRKGKE